MKLSGVGKSFSSDEGRDTSGRSLTAQDIAASISYANLDRLQYLSALYVFANDKAVQNELYYRLEVEAIQIAVDGKWKLEMGLFRRMTRLAISEALHPHKCPVCHGTQHLQTTVAGALLPCEACGASGNLAITNADRAKILGLGIETFNHRWSKNYYSLRGRIEAMPKSALDKVGRVL